jgi:hypothetical protein
MQMVPSLHALTKAMTESGRSVFSSTSSNGAESESEEDHGAPTSSTASSRSLISEPRAKMLNRHLNRLRAILTGDKAAAQKKDLQGGVLHLSERIKMHWLTLTFTSEGLFQSC